MIELTIPGRGTVQLDHLVCDVNGTLALDGKLIKSNILFALELLEKPFRLVATLRK